MKKSTLPKIVSLFFTLAIAQTVFGYDKAGHQAIELRAYDLLKEVKANACHPDGPVMYQWLKDHDYLDQAEQPHSSFPDLSMERQFAQDKQMFHFMAATEDVLAACREQTQAGKQHRLLVPSLRACLEMMYYFSKEILFNNRGASDAGRGLYVLIHIVEDSYSSEHSTRDAKTRLVTIKGWQLSRLSWPSQAKATLPDGTMLLLHNGFDSPGDEGWKGNLPGNLSPMATAAAEAVSDLLVLFYQSAALKQVADPLIAGYFTRHFYPAYAILQNDHFAFAGQPKDDISFDYSGLYEKDPDSVAFKYDRSANITVMAVGATGFSSQQPLAAYGLQWEWFFMAPRAADKKNALLVRLPLAIGASVNEVIRPGRQDFADNLLTKVYLKTAATLPLIGKNLEPFIGISAFPSRGVRRLNTIIGFDISNAFGKNLGFLGWTVGKRINVGYELDFSGYPETHNLTLKMGLNTFKGRISNPPSPTP